MKYDCLFIIVFCLLPYHSMIYAQNKQNEEEMTKEFKKFVLTNEDFDEQPERFDERCASTFPFTHIFIGKPESEISPGDNKTQYNQSIHLKDKTRISLEYTIFDTPEDATKATIFFASNSADGWRMMYRKHKEDIGLDTFDLVFVCDIHQGYGLLFHRGNIVVICSIRPSAESREELMQKKGETMRECHRLAKIIIERIKKMQNEVDTIIKNEEEMIKEFKKFILTHEDFDEQPERFDERCTSPSPLTQVSIDKSEISTRDDRNHYVQSIRLKDQTRIFVDYTILNTPEDATKATIFSASNVAAVRSMMYGGTKEKLGLGAFALAFYSDSLDVYDLLFQYDNIVVNVSIHPVAKTIEELMQKKGETMQECQRLARIIIERIKKM